MTKLPAWIEKLKYCPEGPEHCDGCMQLPRLITALSIAWEALSYYYGRQRGGGSSVPATDAMRRIEELGK